MLRLPLLNIQLAQLATARAHAAVPTRQTYPVLCPPLSAVFSIRVDTLSAWFAEPALAITNEHDSLNTTAYSRASTRVLEK